MGSRSLPSRPEGSEAQERNRGHRSLIVSATVISFLALVGCWFATGAVNDGILNHEGKQVAAQWGLAFAHSLAPPDRGVSEEPIRQYGAAVRPEKLTALDKAIFAGEILGYRIFDRDGVIVAASEFLTIGTRPPLAALAKVISDGTTHAQLQKTPSPGETTVVSAAIVPLVWYGKVHGAIGIDVDMSARAIQLSRLRDLAMLGLAGLLVVVTGIMGASVLRTLSRRHEVEAELLRSEEQYRRLLETSRTAIVIHDDRSIVYANPAAAELHGAGSAAELTGLDPSLLVTTENRSAMLDRTRRFFDSGQLAPQRTSGRRRLDGTTVDTDAYISPVMWNGRPCIQVQAWNITAEIEAQRAVAASEARLSALLANAPFAISIKNLDECVIVANRVYAEIAGRSREEILGKSLIEIFGESNAKIFEAQTRRVLKTGLPEHFETTLRLPGRGERIMLVDKFPVRTPDGETIGIADLLRDITEEKAREQAHVAARLAAERAEQRLSAFLQYSPAGMYIKDTGLRITLANRALQEYVGAGPDGLAGLCGTDFLDKETAARIEAVDREILETGEPRSIEVEFPRADGEIRWMVLEKFPIFSKHGQVVGIGGVNTDVTEARVRNRAVVESEARLSAFLDHAPFMTIFSAPDRSLINVNRGYEEFFGIRNADVVGLKSRPWLTADVETTYRNEQSELLVPGSLIERTIELENAEGKLRTLRQTKFPIVLADGTAVAVGTIMTDITDQTVYERELQRSKEIAEAANRAKSAFLANMSHEIRTPMNGVLGMVEILSQSELTVDQQRLLATARRSGESLLSIINNILDVSRIEAGEFRLEPVEFDLHALVADAVEMLAETTAAKGVFIAHDIGHNVPVHVRGDDVRLRKVVVNLVGNAVKFTHAGEVVIRVVKVGGSPEEPLIRIEVNDTGIGIPQEKHHILFEAFNQLDASISRRYGGSGLGLSISQHIVGLMGGRIEVDSRPGVGSSFVFTIPLQNARPDDTSATQAFASLNGRRLLIADGNATSRSILKRYAVRWDMGVAEAATYDMALGELEGATRNGMPFDLVVVAAKIDSRTAHQAADRIRSEPGRYGLPSVVVLAHSALECDRAEWNADGFAHIAVSPLRRDDFGNILCTALVRDAPEQLSELQSSSPANGNPAWAQRNKTILLAEDNPVNQEITRHYLERQGCRVIVAENGREAVDRFREQAFDLILMDIQMPEMDGIEAVRIIREYEAGEDMARTPIIAATAHAFREDREKCMRAGMDDFLSKPFTRKDIDPILDRWLGPAAQIAPPSAGRPAANSDGDRSVLDEDTLGHLRELDAGGEGSILVKLVGLFLETTPPQMDKLRNVIGNGDCASAAVVAHGLKSSAANVAAAELAEGYREVEKAAREGNIEECRRVLDRTERNFVSACNALRALSQSTQPLRDTA